MSADITDLEERIYAADLDAFVTERTAAAKELRADGRRDEAAAVAKLPKPSVAAWIVNRVSRDEAAAVGALLDAGAALRDVQLGAGSAADLRAASEAQESALRTVMRTAERIAQARGSATPATLDKVRETLHAAALDEELSELVRRGVLPREQRAVGFPLGFAVPQERRRPAAAPKPASAKSKPAAEKRSRAASPGPVDELGAKRRERAAAAARAAHDELERAQETLAAAQDALHTAEMEVEQAREALASAERRARDAGRELARCEKIHARAERDAERALARLGELDGSSS